MLVKQGQLDPSYPARAAEMYRINDVTAGQSGTVGGDD
jgi:pyruvate dehydrogenase E1 component